MPSHKIVIAQIQAVDAKLNVYFQPPESVKMKYPAAVIRRSNISSRYANNAVYGQFDSYTVTIVTNEPASDIIRKVSILPYTSYDRHYIANKLNHDVFTVRINKIKLGDN